MFYLILCLNMFTSQATNELEKAYEYLYKNLTSYDANTVYQSKYNNSNPSFTKLVVSLDMANTFIEKAKKENILSTENTELESAINYANSLLENNDPKADYSASQKDLEDAHNKINFKNKDIKKIDVLALTNFYTADTKEAEELYKTYKNACVVRTTDIDKRRECELNELLANLPSSNQTFHDVISSCCDETSKIEKQSKSFMAMHGLATASELILGTGSLATGISASLAQNMGKSFYKDPKYENQVYKNVKNTWTSFNPSFLSDPIYLYGASYTPYQTNAYGQSYASNFNANPIPNMTSYYKQQNGTARDYNNRNLDISDATKVNNTGINTAANGYAGANGRATNTLDLSQDLENASTGEYIEVGDDQAPARLEASKLLKEEAEYENKIFDTKDQLLAQAFECQTAGIFSKVSCYKKQFEMEGELYQTTDKLMTNRNAQYEIYAVSTMGYYGFLFLDIFKEAINFKVLYAGTTNSSNKKLKIPNLIKPFKAELVFKSDWRERFHKLSLKFKKESKLAEKKANSFKKELKKLLKIKQKDVSMGDLADTTELLKEIKNINMLKKQTIVNQKLIQDSIKYNSKVNTNNEKLKEAKELSTSFNELNKNLDSSMYVDSYYITKDLYNEVPKNTVLRQHAQKLLED